MSLAVVVPAYYYPKSSICDTKDPSGCRIKFGLTNRLLLFRLTYCELHKLTTVKVELLIICHLEKDHIWPLVKCDPFCMVVNNIFANIFLANYSWKQEDKWVVLNVKSLAQKMLLRNTSVLHCCYPLWSIRKNRDGFKVWGLGGKIKKVVVSWALLKWCYKDFLNGD